MTAAGYSYYCTLLPSLFRWPQLLRVAIPVLGAGLPLLRSSWRALADGVTAQRWCHLPTVLLLGGPVSAHGTRRCVCSWTCF